jgi:hypothetical protein
MLYFGVTYMIDHSEGFMRLSIMEQPIQEREIFTLNNMKKKFSGDKLILFRD